MTDFFRNISILWRVSVSIFEGISTRAVKGIEKIRKEPRPRNTGLLSVTAKEAFSVFWCLVGIRGDQVRIESH